MLMGGPVQPHPTKPNCPDGPGRNSCGAPSLYLFPATPPVIEARAAEDSGPSEGLRLSAPRTAPGIVISLSARAGCATGVLVGACAARSDP